MTIHNHAAVKVSFFKNDQSQNDDTISEGTVNIPAQLSPMNINGFSKT